MAILEEQVSEIFTFLKMYYFLNVAAVWSACNPVTLKKASSKILQCRKFRRWTSLESYNSNLWKVFFTSIPESQSGTRLERGRILLRRFPQKVKLEMITDCEFSWNEISPTTRRKKKLRATNPAVVPAAPAIAQTRVGKDIIPLEYQ